MASWHQSFTGKNAIPPLIIRVPGLTRCASLREQQRRPADDVPLGVEDPEICQRGPDVLHQLTRKLIILGELVRIPMGRGRAPHVCVIVVEQAVPEKTPESPSSVPVIKLATTEMSSSEETVIDDPSDDDRFGMMDARGGRPTTVEASQVRVRGETQHLVRGVRGGGELGLRWDPS